MKLKPAFLLVLTLCLFTFSASVANALIRVNAGGGEYTDGSGNLWSADYGYNAGGSASTLDPISGTTDDTLYRSERWDPTPSPDLLYIFDLPNGDYTVNLYFAEIYSGASFIGGRVFDVLIEDQLMLNDLDIFSEVGHDAALMKTFNATVVDGQLNIEFLQGIESPKISAIEVISQGSADTDPPSVPTGLSGTPISSNRIDLTWNPSTDTGGAGLAGYRVYRDGVEFGTTSVESYSDTGLTPDTTYAYTVSAYDNATNESSQSSPPVDVTALSGGGTIIRVNAGGGEYTDGSGNLWSADYGYNAGGSASTLDPISGTTDDTLYRSERWDPTPSPDLLYIFDLPNGDYTVNLYFAEIYSGASFIGGRVFDVLIEDQLMLNDLDIFSEVGHDAALMKTFNATVVDGQLNIEFLQGIESPKISAIEVISQGSADTDPPSVPTGLSGTPISSNRIDLTWNPSTDTGGAGLAGYRVYRDGVEFGTTSVESYSDTGLTPDTTYAYTVSAYDNATNESSQSSPPVDVTALSGGGTIIRVNAGGGEYTDGSGNLWSADYGYNAGGSASTLDPISGTTDDTLYRSERWDPTPSPDLLYIFDLPNGDYTVNLYFAEIYSGASFIGGRVFDVLIEDQLMLNDLDIFSEVGHDAALMKTFNATVVDGQLNIEFLQGIESPKISAIEVMSGSAFGPFSDNFNDGTPDGWSVIDDSMNTSDWQVVSGEYNQHNNVEERDTGGIPFDGTYHRGTFAFLPLGTTLLTNYRFSVDATSLSEAGHDIGVMFRYWDNNNYYRLSLSSKYGFTRFEKRVAGNFVALATNARGYQFGQQLSIVVDVRGSLINIYLNGDPLFSISDTSIPSGSIALYCQDSAKFDNVIVDYNSTVPSIVISSPIAHSIEKTDTFIVSAVATNVTTSGGDIEFLLDGTMCGNLIPVSTDGLYNSECSNVAQGDHTLEAILYDSGSQVAIDINEKIGVLGNYLGAVGDSITNGLMDNFSLDNILSNDERIIALQGYEANLSNLLTDTNGYPSIVFNEAIEGDESYDAAYTRIDSVLKRHSKADKILILLGTNDSNVPVLSGRGCSGSSCAGTFKENMQLLINKVVADGKTAVVGRVLPAFGSYSEGIFPDPLNAQRNQLIQDYNYVIEYELTNAEVGPDFFSFFLSATVNRSSLIKDYSHPNGLGYPVVGHLWHNYITGIEILPFILDDIFPSTYKQNLLEVGDTYYADEMFTLTSIPSELEGGIWIMTDNADKENTQDDFLSFTVDRSVNVYVAYDPRATILPNWLNDFVYAGTLGVSDPGTPILDLYRYDNITGVISLGGNLAGGASGALSNYLVIVVAN